MGIAGLFLDEYEAYSSSTLTRIIFLLLSLTRFLLFFEIFRFVIIAASIAL